jgi:hypothetical protein
MTNPEPTPAAQSTDLVLRLMAAAVEALPLHDPEFTGHAMAALRQGRFAAVPVHDHDGEGRPVAGSLRYVVLVPHPTDPGDRLPLVTVGWEEAGLCWEDVLAEHRDALARMQPPPSVW